MHVCILYMLDDYLLALLPSQDTSPHLTVFFCHRKEPIEAVLWKKKSYTMSPIFLFYISFPFNNDLISFLWYKIVHFLFSYSNMFYYHSHIFFLIIDTWCISHVDKNNWLKKQNINMSSGEVDSTALIV